MAQPPERKFTDLARQIRSSEKKKPKRERSRTSAPSNVRKVLLTLLLLIIAAGAGYYLLKNLPVSSSLSGDYDVPTGVSEIEDYSRARWHLHDTHASVLSTCVAWYMKSTDSDSGDLSLAVLEQVGFLPFRLIRPTGEPVTVTQEMPGSGAESGDYIIVLGNYSKESTSIITRKTFEKSTVLGDGITSNIDDTLLVTSDDFTSFIRQFQPDEPSNVEIYAGFTAQLWDKALPGYIRTYNRPPSSLIDLMSGLGLVLNPDNVWPFEENIDFDAGSEGGIVDGEIVYWKVMNEDGTSGGQARYYDQYTPYDDPDTPNEILAGGRSSAVASPSDLDGEFDVMFSLQIYHDMLFELITPVETDDDN